MARRLLLAAALAGLACAGLAGGGVWYLGHRSGQPLQLDATTIVIAPGTPLVAAVDALAAAGAGPRWLLTLRARQRGLVLRRGEYQLVAGETVDGLLDRLAAGKVVQHSFRIAEGSTVRDVLRRMAADGRLAFDLAGADAADLMPRLGLAGHAEGWFFPDTYLFVRGERASALLARAREEMARRLAATWRKRQPGLGLETQRQALVLASLVEKETGAAADRRRVAGVFLRRLAKGMRLQSDPTVIYGLGENFDGNLTRAHLAADGPYNTYRRPGLPPTPIALPSLASLEAAVDPAAGEALYFVARGDGSSHFSATLAEHNDAVRRYQLR